MTPDQTATARTAARIAKTIAQTVSAIENSSGSENKEYVVLLNNHLAHLLVLQRSYLSTYELTLLEQEAEE